MGREEAAWAVVGVRARRSGTTRRLLKQGKYRSRNSIDVRCASYGSQRTHRSIATLQKNRRNSNSMMKARTTPTMTNAYWKSNPSEYEMFPDTLPVDDMTLHSGCLFAEVSAECTKVKRLTLMHSYNHSRSF